MPISVDSQHGAVTIDDSPIEESTAQGLLTEEYSNAKLSLVLGCMWVCNRSSGHLRLMMF